MARKKVSPGKKGQVTSARRKWGQLAGGKARVFRPSPDVAEMLDALVAESGRTQSAIIDEGLRRVVWNEQKYADTLIRNFGGHRAFARAYLFARITCAIEHMLQANESSSEVVAKQIEKATGALAAMHDLEVRDASGTLVAVMQTKHKQNASDFASWRPGQHPEAAQHRPDLEPWQLVFRAIDRNLADSGDQLWWPLSDVTADAEGELTPQVPLRPSINELRAIWRWKAIDNA